ncbi:kinase-like domain-containing protein [Gigaspora rosea]|uniref:Kinase-like domain-containing protein n=1 Tax=Gigaspora rosea TaxID=44941 RepID=A0A397UKC5_9GLOM|nr:kinase-like domain-containing protein [Gigaspora rosea]
MSYMSYGSLNEYLSKNFKDITWIMRLRFLRDIVKGIKWIHENKIMHRDIHDGNILLEKYNTTGSFIADLGFSRPVNEDPEGSEPKIYGIMPYVAPEVFNEKQYSFSSDIYSLGMIMWELTTGQRPFCDRAYDIHLMLNICSELRPDITEDTPFIWAILMQQCWHSDPLKRPSINEIYNEINSSYWNVNKIFIDAENKRQELLESGKFIVKSIHPHSKTHSQLLNPTIDSMLSNLFQNSRASTSSSIDYLQRVGSCHSFNIM